MSENVKMLDCSIGRDPIERRFSVTCKTSRPSECRAQRAVSFCLIRSEKRGPCSCYVKAVSLGCYRRAMSGDTDNPETGCNGRGVIRHETNGRILPDARLKVSCWDVRLVAWLQETDTTLATPTQRRKAVAFTKKQFPEYRSTSTRTGTNPLTVITMNLALAYSSTKASWATERRYDDTDGRRLNSGTASARFNPTPLSQPQSTVA